MATQDGGFSLAPRNASSKSCVPACATRFLPWQRIRTKYREGSQAKRPAGLSDAEESLADGEA